jgi:hypothetical protein
VSSSSMLNIGGGHAWELDECLETYANTYAILASVGVDVSSVMVEKHVL